MRRSNPVTRALLPLLAALPAVVTGQTVPLTAVGRSSPDVPWVQLIALTLRPATGDVFALDVAPPYVYEFGPDGDIRQSFGRRGAGPGELEQPRALGWHGDTLWVADTRNRLTYYTADAKLVRSIRVATEASGLPGAQSIAPAADGGVYLVGRQASGHVVLAHGSVGKRVARHLLVAPQLADEASYLPIPIHVGAATGIARPFMAQGLSRHTLLAARGDRALMVQRDQADRFHVTVVRAAGDTAFRMTFAYRPMPVSSAALRVWAEEIGGTLSRGSKVPLQVDPEDVVKALGSPGPFPPVSDIVLGTDESVWLRREDDPSQATVIYWVLNGQGILAGMYELPRSDRVAHVTRGRAWAIRTAADGTTSLVWYKVPNPGR